MDKEILHTYIDIFRDYVYKGEIGNTLVLRKTGEKGKYIPTVDTKYCDESYKEDVFTAARKHIAAISSSSTDGDVITAVEAALKECNNLISWESINPTVELFGNNEHGFADIFKRLYCCETDESNDRICFETLCKKEFIGRKYQILAYLFFIKDKDSYLPASPNNFDSLFRLIGIKSNMAYHCSWENYSGFIQNIRDVQTVIEERLHCNVSLLTTHSIVWILGILKNIPLEVERMEQAEESYRIPSSDKDINLNSPEFDGTPKAKPPYDTRKSSYFRRDRRIAQAALKKANHKCEIDKDHPTFVRKANGEEYTEAHHLIPLAYQYQFKYSLDNIGNVVSLCSHCHNRLHHGRDLDYMVRQLFETKREELEKAGLLEDIKLDQLLLMYK